MVGPANDDAVTNLRVDEGALGIAADEEASKEELSEDSEAGPI